MLIKLVIVEVKLILGDTETQRGKVNLSKIMELTVTGKVASQPHYSPFRIHPFNNEYLLSSNSGFAVVNEINARSPLKDLKVA